MTKKTLIIWLAFMLVVSGLLSPGLYAIEKRPGGFEQSHFVGGRAGAWALNGNDAFIDSLEDFSSSALYVEFFYAHRLAPISSLELSIGLFSQGDMKYNSDQGIIVGAVKIYPIFLSGKIYPLSAVQSMSFLPYLRLGGGIVYGTRDISTVYYNDPANYYVEESQTKFTYLWGAGIDWPIADQIGLNVDFKYTPAKFGKPLAGLEDYSGWTLTFGVGYILKPR